MTREKSPRPASLTEAVANLQKAKGAFDKIVASALEEATTGDINRAECLIKEGHSAMLNLKDVYNRAYGQILSAAAAARAKDRPKEEKKAKREPSEKAENASEPAAAAASGADRDDP